MWERERRLAWGKVLFFCIIDEIPTFAYLKCGMEHRVYVRLKHGVQSMFDRDVGWYTYL